MITHIRYFILLFLFTTLNSCDKEIYEVISLESEFDLVVTSIRTERTSLYANDKYLLDGVSELVYEKDYPYWLKKDIEYNWKGDGDVINEKLPILLDVKTPYKLSKVKNSNYFTLIKNNDSLIFFIRNIN